MGVIHVPAPRPSEHNISLAKDQQPEVTIRTTRVLEEVHRVRLTDAVGQALPFGRLTDVRTAADLLESFQALRQSFWIVLAVLYVVDDGINCIGMVSLDALDILAGDRCEKRLVRSIRMLCTKDLAIWDITRCPASRQSKEHNREHGPTILNKGVSSHASLTTGNTWAKPLARNNLMSCASLPSALFRLG